MTKTKPYNRSSCFVSSLKDLSLFPDGEDSGHVFNEDIARRTRDLGRSNATPLLTQLTLTSNDPDILEALEGPTFEKLWECSLYLRDVVAIGRQRQSTTIDLAGHTASGKNRKDWIDVKDICESSVIAFSEYFSSYILDLPNYWWTWCNNLLIEALQKLIPYKFPNLAWKCIVTHLSNGTQGNRSLDLQLETISRDQRLQVIEKCLLQECTLLCTELVKMFALVLYSTCSLTNLKYISASITKYMQLFNSSMMRLNVVLTSTNQNTSNCLLFRFTGEEVHRPWAFTANLSCIATTPVLMNVACANAEFQHNSPYFVWLEKESDDTLLYSEYQLAYSQKGKPHSFASITSLPVQDNIPSKSRPLLFCSGSLIAVVTTEESKVGDTKWFLSVWDLDTSPSDTLFKYKLDRLTGVFNKRGLTTEGIELVRGIGLTKEGSMINVIVSIRFKCGEQTAACCFVLTFDLKKLTSATEQRSPRPKTMLSDSVLIAFHENFVFAIHIDPRSPMLFLHNFKNNLKPLTMVEWDWDNPWNVRFNCNPDKDTCILYRKNEVQVRKLDDNLTFVRDIILVFESCSPLKDPCFQFYDNILYGWRRYSIQENETENRYAYQITHSKELANVEEFFMAVFHAYDEQFVIDLDEELAEPIYFETIRPLKSYSKPNDPSNITYQIPFTGFTPSGELVQMVLSNSTYDYNNNSIDSVCQYINMVTVVFHKTFTGLIRSLFPEVKTVLEEYNKSKERIAERIAEQNAARLREKMLAEKRAQEVKILREKQEMKKKEKKTQKAKQKQQELFARERNTGAVRRRERALRYINSQRRFGSVITKWFPHNVYGFAEILIDGEIESVFVHANSILDRDVFEVEAGTYVEFRIEWDPYRPRPKAVDTTVCEM